MTAKPLTKEEIDWLDQLESVLMKCPSKRLEAYTIGDQDLQFFDADVAKAWELENDDPHAFRDAPSVHSAAGSALRRVRTNFNISSCAG